MIPEICANCATATNISGEGGVIAGTVCYATPLKLFMHPDDTCGTFKMSKNPPIQTEEQNVVEQGNPFDEVHPELGDGEQQA